MLLPNEHPAPHRLLAEPELAALAILDAALEIVQAVIVAAHPGWADTQCRTHPPTGRCGHAGMIGMMAYELQETVGEYLRDQPWDPDEE